MKFGKEFTAQMVPEWQQAYMDYNQLKSILKGIMITRQKYLTDKSLTTERSLKRKVSLYRAFSGLIRNSTKKRDDEASLIPEEYCFGPPDKASRDEPVFFDKLDDEFDKVVSFYRSTVEKVVAEADELSKQMDVLIALRIKVLNPRLSFGEYKFEDIANSSSKQEVKHMDAIQEIEMTRRGGIEEEEEEEEGNEQREISQQSSGNSSTRVEGKIRSSRLEVLDNVKINVGRESAISTLKTILVQALSSSEFTKDQLKKSEELMVQAFVELYQKLRLLKSYRFMNRLAFSKIMKKYDKITKRNESNSYLDKVDMSDLGSCDKVNRLMERVEAAFTKHFANGDRGRGMSILRPVKRRERHTITFFLGFLSGCSLALIVTIAVLIHVRKIIKSEGRGKYMENIFPLYSLFGFIVLHMLMFSANIYYWKRYQVNYPFIFGLKEETLLEYREVFLLSAGLSVLSLAGVISNLNMEMDPRTRAFTTLPELVPLILVCALLIILFCPFNMIYRSARFFLLSCLLHCALAPLYKVTLPDFFLADQMTSQVQAFRSLEFYICYYIWGNFKTRDSDTCLRSKAYEALYIVVGIIPYWIRFLQCLRRLIEEKDKMHTWNGLKYFTIIVAVSLRTLYEQKKGKVLLVLAASSSGVATIFATYWDIVLDWGLLQKNSKNRWLRDKLIIPNKTVYFVAIVLNCLLRLAWMQTVLGFRETPFLHGKALIAIFASLEIIRRGIWNFFRLENEHLNNVGKYRAFKSVPLPFNYENREKDS